MLNSIFLQAKTAADVLGQSVETEEVATKSISIMDMILGGGIGSILIMGALFILSILTIYILILYLYLRTSETPYNI